MAAVLQDEVICFASRHLPSWAEDCFIALVEKLGGSTTEDEKECTMLIVNPRSPYYIQLVEERRNDSKTRHHLPPLIPYPYLSICDTENKRVPISSLPSPIPYFVHPSVGPDENTSMANEKKDDDSHLGRPLRAWVSINVQRYPPETPESAQRNIESLLTAGGAVIVTKRAQADVLIVNRNTSFYKTVKDEKEKYQRHWQRLAERNWVESCAESGNLSWETVGEDIDREGEVEAEEEDDDVDSMAEDEDYHTNTKKRGQGRPVGGARIDYTPADDDFLCRYLARYHPTGSWGSRKTYENLVQNKRTYPLAARHTAQSWHQRFKSNSIPFTNRVRKFMGAGVDESLKTKAEREASEAKSRAEQFHLPSEPGPSKAGTSNGGTSLAAVAASDPTTENTSERLGKRKLVESDDEEDSPAAQSASKTAKGSKNSTKSNVEVTETTAPTSNLAPIFVPETSNPALTASFESILPNTQQVNGVYGTDSRRENGKRTSEADASVDRAISDSQEKPTGTQEESQPSGGTALGEEETQAVLSNFNRAKANPPARSNLAIPVGEDLAQPTSPGKRKSVRIDVTELELVSASVSTRESNPIPRSSPVPVRAVSDITRPGQESNRTRRSTASPSARRPPSHLTGRSHGVLTPTNAGTSTSTTMSIPFTLSVDIRGTDGQNHPNVNVHVTPEGQHNTKFTTPSPNLGYTSQLRQKLMSSADKRRQSLDRAALRGSKSTQLTPDLVYRTTRIESTINQDQKQDQNSTSGSPVPSSIPAPATTNTVLSPAERSEKILKGQALVMEIKEQYRIKIQALSERYGLTPTDVFRAVNELPKRAKGKGSEVYWKDVEDGLKLKYGH